MADPVVAPNKMKLGGLVRVADDKVVFDNHSLGVSKEGSAIWDNYLSGAVNNLDVLANATKAIKGGAKVYVGHIGTSGTDGDSQLAESSLLLQLADTFRAASKTGPSYVNKKSKDDGMRVTAELAAALDKVIGEAAEKPASTQSLTFPKR